LEVGFRPVIDQRGMRLTAGFQSLICWKSDSDLYSALLISFRIVVSILDLLEVGFRPQTAEPVAEPKPAFQSLICWKSDSDQIFFHFVIHAAPQFQSLICWKSDSDLKDEYYSIAESRSFNP